MLRVFSLAGKTLATFSAEEVEGKTVKSLKTLVGKQIGVTRFRQKWLAEDQSELPDDAVVPCSDVQLVVLNFVQADAGEVEKLVQASSRNHVDQVDELLRTPMNPNPEGELAISGKLLHTTPLHVAAVKGHTEVVKLLLEAGADKNAAVLNGRAALHLGAMKGHSEVVKLLLEAGADKDATSFAGMTALHLAAVFGCLEVAKLLLEAGAEKNAATDPGKTPLHLSVENGRTEVVKLLLAAGADQNLANLKGEKPIDRAIFRRHHEVINLLKSEHRTKRQKV